MTLGPGMRVAGRYETLAEETPAPAVRRYRALDLDAEVEVELWVVREELLPAGEGARAVFVGAAQKAVEARHPALRRVFGAGVDEEGAGVWVALQRLDGESLSERIAGEPLGDEELTDLARAIGEGLAVGLVHGFLRPEDVLVLAGAPKVSGAGLWGALDPVAAAAAFRPDWRYISPEVRAGQPATPRSDVYSVGTILAALAVGQTAESVGGGWQATLARMRPALAEALGRATAVDPAERPGTVAELAVTLARAREREARSKPAPGSEPPAAVSPAEAGGPDRPCSSGEQGRPPSSEPGLAEPRRDASPPSGAPEPRRDASPPSGAPEPRRAPPPMPGPAEPPGAAWPSAPSAAEIVPVEIAAPGAVVPGAILARKSRRPLFLAFVGGSAVASALLLWFAAELSKKPAPAPPPAPMPAREPTPPPAPAPGPPGAAPVLTEKLEPCPPGMILVASAPAFCIDPYEVPGLGFVPVTRVTLDEARRSCESQGKRLCTAAEWERACRGPNGASYPYGATFVAGKCNVRPRGRPSLSAAGAFSECVSAAGAYDMSGNAAEWVAEGVTKGGSVADGEDGRCSTKVRRSPGYSAADVGYRCCASPGAF